MSWIATLMKIPAEIKDLTDLPKDFMPEPIGAKKDILSLLAQLFPDAGFTDPTWVTLERDEYVIEFMVGEDDPVMSLGFRPHGADSVIEVLRLLCERAGCRAIDDGVLIDFDDNPAQGFQEWHGYAQKAVGSSFEPKGVRLSVSAEESRTPSVVEKLRKSLGSILHKRSQ